MYWAQRGGCDLRCAQYIEYVFQHEGDVAAVVAEPIRYGAAVPHPDYWKTVRQLCDEHGALLIFDEIPSGLGRTGRLFATEHFDVVPDILILGKGLGGGILPLAAMLAREQLDIAGHRALGHYTHEKNPVLCAAALATLDELESQSLPQRAARLGNHALERLRSMQDRYPLIGEVRGIGLLLAVELVRDRRTREPATEQAERLMYLALDRGLSFKLTGGNTITLAPPLTISDEQLDQALDILDNCFQHISGEHTA